jgi:hypothetical protein
MIIVAASPSVDFTAVPKPEKRENEQQKKQINRSSNLPGSLHIRESPFRVTPTRDGASMICCKAFAVLLVLSLGCATNVCQDAAVHREGTMFSKPINSRPHWNKTGFQVTAGKTYRLRAGGMWCDATNKHDANGYEKPSLDRWRRFRRVRSAPWFALIGTVEGRDAFVIGTDKTWTATRSGELWCYANDVWFMYWNNRGSVTLEIEEQ